VASTSSMEEKTKTCGRDDQPPLPAPKSSSELVGVSSRDRLMALTCLQHYWKLVWWAFRVSFFLFANTS
jgi:hypothetical protein